MGRSEAAEEERWRRKDGVCVCVGGGGSADIETERVRERRGKSRAKRDEWGRVINEEDNARGQRGGA